MKKLICIFMLCIMILSLCACSNKSKLAKYVTNYDEVVTKLEEDFNSKVKIRDNEQQNSIQTLEQFGNGTYYIFVNDILVTVLCEDHIATGYTYYNGNAYQVSYTKSGLEKRDQFASLANQGVPIVATEASDVFK